LHDNLVLLALLLADEYSFGSIDSLVHLEAKEVLDLCGLDKRGLTLPLSITLTTMQKWE
jgi:hypothetical protein